MTRKLAFIIQGGNDKFLPPILQWCEQRFECRIFCDSSEASIREALDWADITWVEWVQAAAVIASRCPRRGKLIMRLHSFEAYTSLPAQVHWKNVDTLAVVAPHVADILSLRIPALNEQTRIFVLPNGIDIDRFNEASNKKRTGKIAFVGQLRHTKNLPLILQCFAAAYNDDHNLTLHLAGEWAGTELEVAELALYIDHMTHALGLETSVHMHGQVADMPGWLADKDHLISCSIRESFGYNIAEAMACGVRPAIHNFPGAGSLYPAELIFNTVEQCRSILTENTTTPTSLRTYAANHWPLKLQHAKLAELIAISS